MRSPCAVSIHLPQLSMDDPAALQSARAGLTSLFVALAMWGAAWIVAGSSAKQAAPIPPTGDARLPRNE
ncbi:MAG: hypothetical protein ACRD6I_16495 [Candidatus Acidiferrales bacterium]